MKLKVIHILDIFPSKSETFVINLILESIEKGYSAQILANRILNSKDSSQESLLLESGLYKNAETFNPNIPQNKLKRILLAIKVLLYNIRYMPVFFKTLNTKRYGLKAKTLKMWFQASIFLKYREADIFHAHFGKNGKLLSEMKDIGAIKGDIITSFYGYDTFSTDNDRTYFKNYYKSTFVTSNNIVTSSRYLFNNLICLGVPEHKVLINPVGVNIDLFRYRNRVYSNRLHIITIGRLIRLKGQHLGIDVIKILKGRGYNVQYTIMGDGDEYHALIDKIEKLELKEEITILKGGSQEKVLEELYKNHLFLMTSIKDDLGREEGQGLVVAEAQSTGIPIVCFNSGGVPETVLKNKTGFVIEEGNINEMANAVEKFILTPDLIVSMGKDARCFVEENFNNKIQSQNILRLYK